MNLPRLVFMGTAAFGVPTLEILLANRYPVVAVVTNPDKPAGRGLKQVSSPVKKAAAARGLEILQPESLKDPAFLLRLKELGPDIAVVVAFRILPDEALGVASRGSFNLHASLLPKYRGAAPIQRAILQGETETGVTTFFLQRKVDTGDIILQARTGIGENETAGEVYDRLSAIGAEIALHTVRLIEQGKAAAVPQDPGRATPAPKIFKEECNIDWSRPAAQVHNFIRGLSPVPGAYTFHRSTQLKLFRSRVAAPPGSSAPGMVIESGGRLVVAAGEGAVDIVELQQEGKKTMTAQEFLRGYRIGEGESFTNA